MSNEKILIVSHNPLSDTQNNGKTLLSFFSNRESDSVCQLFFTMDVPNCSHFNKFFQITDLQLLKRFFGKKSICGQIVMNEDPMLVVEKRNLNKSVVYKIIRYIALKRVPIITILRNILWREKRWKTESLVKWIDLEKPDIVFFQSGGARFSFDIVKWICETWNIPLIMETTDDYVTGKYSLSPFYWLSLGRLQKAYKWATNHAYAIITICDAMADEYEKRFGGRYFVAMNSVVPDESNIKLEKKEEDIITLVYAGNLGIGRWRILGKISEALQQLDKKGIKGCLYIYSLNPPSKKVSKCINKPPYSKYMGSLAGRQLKEAINSATCVVHVESFDAKYKHITRLSMSTKIPEYMNSNSCILAIGPSDVASIRYLKENGIAEVVNNQDEKDIIKSLIRITDINTRNNLSQKANMLLKQSHDIKRTQQMIEELICKAVSK